MNTVDEMEECVPTSSFGEVYCKQLELDEVRVETERSRQQRENKQYLIRMEYKTINYLPLVSKNPP